MEPDAMDALVAAIEAVARAYSGNDMAALGHARRGLYEALAAWCEAPGGRGRFDKTCACGTPLVRNGVTVNGHWIGAVCDECVAASYRESAERGAK